MRRTDARRNRERILRVADEAFATGSEIVPLAEIARRVGLGRATVYRHFPDRAALGTAIASQHLGTIADLVRGDPPPYDSFRDLLELVLTEQAARRPLVRLFRELPPHCQRRYADALVATLTPAFRRAQEEGQLRADAEPADLLLVFEMLEAAVLTGAARGHSEDAIRRMITVVLDGFFGA
ncbi:MULTISPECIES: TetR/AcrR family transcriptional regulator [Amycolatopsis]|uniref:TetR/AcrR family transcriptional regulator n=1 Tax=Amycolatopsis TaxID=1813 RepID=UPI0031F74C52